MAVFPPSIERTTAAMAERVRRRRAIRGLAIVVFIGLCTAALAVLADFAFDLPKVIRWILFLGWVTVIGLAVRKFVIHARRAGHQDSSFAGPIEAIYPNFAERLLTLDSVAAGTASWSSHLVAQLKKECEKRAHVVDPVRTVSYGRAVQLAVVAVVTVFVAITALLIVPGGPSRAKRFIMPWSDGRPPSAFRIVVTSGAPVIARGSHFPITVYLDRVRPNGELPNSLIARVRNAKGQLSSVVLQGQERGVYAGHWPNVREDFQYGVTFNGDESDWYQVKVDDLVQLTSGTKTTIEPPPYAKPIFTTQESPGFSELETIQHATVRWHWVFDHPVQSGSLEFRHSASRNDNVSLQWSDDRRSATAVYHALESGRLTLRLTSERGLTSQHTIAFIALPDQPPRFDSVNGLAHQAMEIKPGERLPIRASVSDDLAITAFELEYRIANSQGLTKSIPISTSGLGQKFVEGKILFDTSGLCPTGETLHVRLRATDNRSVPEHNLTAQTTTFPADGWLPLRVTSSARPLAEQQIFGQRDRVADSLLKALIVLNDARQTIATLAGANVYQLSDDQLVKLTEARERLTLASELLVKAGKDASVIPELKPVSAEAAAIVNGPIASAQDLASKASTDVDSASRRTRLRSSHQSTVEAVDRTEKLIELNDRLSKRRLEQRLMADLATEERDLADRFSRATTDGERAAIRAEQEALQNRLASTIREHEGLRNAVDDHARRKAADAAKTIEDIKTQAAELNKQREDAETKAMSTRNAEFAEKQKQLAEQVARMTGSASNPSRQATSATERFRKGDSISAMADQEAAARELDQWAEGISRAANARKDPKEAARQIAMWQQDYANRAREVTKSLPFAQLPQNAKDILTKEATAIARAIESLSVPANLEKKKKTAAEMAIKISERDQIAAVAATRELAEKLPPLADRWKQTKIEVNKLTDTLNEIAKQLADSKTPAETAKALQPKQIELTIKLASLDAPGMERRKTRAIETSRTIEDDLKSGRASDATTGINQLKKQFDRLRQALSGNEPVDDLLDRLARQQDEIARQIDQLPPQPPAGELDRLSQLQREVGRDLAAATTGESPSLMRDAKNAVEQADKAAREKTNPNVDELKKKSKQAANALNQLANRAGDAESESDRLQRLIRNRDSATANAVKNQNQPPNPDASAAAKQAAQSDLDELLQSRSAGHDELRAKAAAALNRLKQAGAPDRHSDLQKQAAEALSKLQEAVAQDVNAKKSIPRETPKPDFDSQSAHGLPTADRAKAAKELAQAQRQIRDQASQTASRGTAATGEAIRKAEGDLAKRIGQLATDLKNDATSAALSGTPTGQAMSESLKQSADAAGRAAQQAERGVRETANGRADSATEARNQRDQELAKAGKALKGTDARPSTPGSNPFDAATSMRQAGQAMDESKNDAARNAMRQAADHLEGRDQASPNSNESKGPPEAKPSDVTAIPLPPDLKMYEGRSWGELPGDVRNRIVQDFAAKYGDEYARLMKLYFEQRADMK